MICEQCGKSNIDGVLRCTYCGAGMPSTTACGGFADILTFQDTQATTSLSSPLGENAKTEGMYDADMQKLLKKSDNIIKTTKKNASLSMVAIMLSILIFISSLMFGFATLSAMKGYQKELDELKQELREESEAPLETAPPTPTPEHTPEPTTSPRPTWEPEETHTPTATATTSASTVSSSPSPTAGL